MQAHGAEIAYLFNLLAEIGGRRMFSHTPKGDLRANQGVMAMSREGASAPYWRYRSDSEKLTMSTSRTARRPPSVATAIAYRRTSLRSVRLAKAALGTYGVRFERSSGSSGSRTCSCCPSARCVSLLYKL